ncbi:hypothetical protein ACPTFK_30125, partial [Pseudomonas aeruginosa]|uniref:hypothetical protein n=1 Tax=Pseudomonas aeruginosa TaxID=287 RepID=UPI003CC515E4
LKLQQAPNNQDHNPTQHTTHNNNTHKNHNNHPNNNHNTHPKPHNNNIKAKQKKYQQQHQLTRLGKRTKIIELYERDM